MKNNKKKEVIDSRKMSIPDLSQVGSMKGLVTMHTPSKEDVVILPTLIMSSLQGLLVLPLK